MMAPFSAIRSGDPAQYSKTCARQGNGTNCLIFMHESAVSYEYRWPLCPNATRSNWR